jgi:hypothetical protein
MLVNQFLYPLLFASIVLLGFASCSDSDSERPRITMTPLDSEKVKVTKTDLVSGKVRVDETRDYGRIDLPDNFEVLDNDGYQILKRYLQDNALDSIFITTNLVISGVHYLTESIKAIYCCLKAIREGDTYIVDKLDFMDYEYDPLETVEQFKTRLITRDMFMYWSAFPIHIKSVILHGTDLGPFTLGADK